MLSIFFGLSARIWTVLRYAPSNLLIRWLRQRRHLKWGTLAIPAGLAYLAAAYALTRIIEDGGPGWLHLFVLVTIWSGLKLLAFGPVSLAILLATRLREWRTARLSRAGV